MNTLTHSEYDKKLKKLAQIERDTFAKRIIEALLFSSNEPIALSKIHEIIQEYFAYTTHQIETFLSEMKEEYEESGFAVQLDQIGGGYILRTREIFRPYLEKLHGQKKREKLSHAALEVLAIISHKQPITRPQIDALRGVDSSNVMHVLLEHELIENAGKSETPGRASLYVVTEKFKQYFTT